VIHKRRDDCRACRSTHVETFLDLGRQPLANALPDSPKAFAEELRFPLEVCLCTDCGLIQLIDVVDPEILFGQYLYLTGMSATMEAHHREHADSVIARLGLGRRDLVVDVASNDGSLLLAYQRRGHKTLGVEPAANVAEVARGRGIDTACVFFDPATARSLVDEHGHAAAVFANNVLAHVDDPRGFLEGLAIVAGDEGTVVVEVPYVRHLLDRFEYDTVYHEHLSYFSVTALAHLYATAGMRILGVERRPIHGGSLRIWARRDAHREGHDPSLEREVQGERTLGLADLGSLRNFAREVREHREALREMLLGLRSDGRTVAAYGAPAKGSTLLNYCDVGADVLDFTVDKNPLKVGRYLPGVHIPILHVDQVLARQPDHLLILPWNLEAEIRAQEQEYAVRGGRFVIPIPTPHVI